jgi:hypothetical protein
MSRLLSDREIEQIGTDYYKLDCCNELYLNRGHWERIAPHIAKAQDVKTITTLIKWLEEPCDKHISYEIYDDKRHWIKDSDGGRVYKYHLRRMTCPNCWHELREIKI